MPERFEPDDPREWLNRARSALAMASQVLKGAYFEDLCFWAQQAAEKAIKAVLIRREIEFPYTHNLVRLAELLELGPDAPPFMADLDRLNPYAVLMRYPFAQVASETDYLEALATAEAVVLWAEEQIGYRAD